MNRLFFLLLLIVSLFFTACSTRGKRVYYPSESAQSSSDNSVNKKTYSDPKMRPYVVRGIKYYPKVVNVGDIYRGIASWYGPDFHGNPTANGEKYSMYEMTAAHKTLPMNTIVKVTNINNGLVAIVRINDRGPFHEKRIIDLSKAAAKKIDMIGTGTASVRLEILGSKNKTKLGNSSQKKFTTKFALQIASFSEIDGAILTQEKYDNTDGYKTVIKDMQNENGRIFKVWLKGFKSEEEARDYKSQGHFENAFIVKED